MRLLILINFFLLTSCSSTTNIYTPSSGTNYKGSLWFDTSFAVSNKAAIEKMEQLCKLYGGLDFNSVVNRGNPIKKGEGSYQTKYTYSCNKAL